METSLISWTTTAFQRNTNVTCFRVIILRFKQLFNHDENQILQKYERLFIVHF